MTGSSPDWERRPAPGSRSARSPPQGQFICPKLQSRFSKGFLASVVAGAYEDESYKNLSRAWIVARGLAGLDDVRLHDLRHSYASLAARCGISLQMIGKLLGHKVPATTARYVHARDAAAGINNQVGAAITAAIDNQAPTTSASVVKLRHRQRAAPGSPKRSGPAFSVRFLPLNR